MRRNTTPRRSFTTTLPDALLRELDRAAKELKVPKNDIVAEALTMWNKERNQARLAESYQRVQGKDRADLIRRADEGLDAWERTIRHRH